MELINMLSERELTGEQESFLAKAVLAGAHLYAALDGIDQALQGEGDLTEAVGEMLPLFEADAIYLPGKGEVFIRAVTGQWLTERYGFLTGADLADVETVTEAFHAAQVDAGFEDAAVLEDDTDADTTDDDTDEEPETDKKPEEDGDADLEPAQVEDTEEVELVQELLVETGIVVGLTPHTFAHEDGTEQVIEAAEPTVPVMLRIRLIEPGWGNTRDNHYYPRRVLERDASLFSSAPMYLTDHVPAESNVRNWAANVLQVDEFSDTGAPIANVLVHKPEWCAHVRNLAEADPPQLQHLAVSIRAMGLTRPYKDDEREGKSVEAFTDVLSVDFVSRAGAGGGALGVATEAAAADAETATEPGATFTFQDGVPVEEQLAALAELPGGQELVRRLREQLSDELGAGHVAAMGDQTPQQAGVSEEDVEARKLAALRQHGFTRGGNSQ